MKITNVCTRYSALLAYATHKLIVRNVIVLGMSGLWPHLAPRRGGTYKGIRIEQTIIHNERITKVRLSYKLNVPVTGRTALLLYTVYLTHFLCH